MGLLRQTFKDLANKFVTDSFVDFKKTFTIESATKTPDGQGGFTVSWTTFATIDGFVTPNKGKEIIKDDHIFSDYDFKFSFQHIANISNDMRVNYNSKLYNIKSINSIKDVDVWINIYAKENTAT